VTRTFPYDFPVSKNIRYGRYGGYQPDEEGTLQAPPMREEVVQHRRQDPKQDPIQKRPPLGIIPRRLFLEGRITGLTDAISRNLSEGRWAADYLHVWSEELAFRLKEYRRLYCNENQQGNR